MKTITDRQQEILDLFLVHGNKRKVARELGINESSVRYALRAAEAKGLAPWLSPVAIPDHLSLSKTKHTTYVCPEVTMKLYNDKLSASQMKIFSKHFELAIEELLKTPEVVERRNKAMERANKTKGTKC